MDPAVLAGLAIQLASHPPDAWHVRRGTETPRDYALRMACSAELWVEAARDALHGPAARAPDRIRAVGGM